MSILHTDAVDLVYDDSGSGGPPLLLIHGFSCARTDFGPLTGHFTPTHRVVAFDQRGHGGSSVARDGRYGFLVDVEDARRLCDELGLDRPVVVGHSLGGVTALHLAAQPGFASALVLLDATIDIPAEVQGELAAFVEGLEVASHEDFCEQVRQYARYRMIDPSDDAAVAAELVERSARVPQDVYVPGVRSIVGVDVLATARAVTVPSLFIASSLPWIDPAEVHRQLPGWFVGRTVGAGHFHHLLVPEQVNAMVERFLASVADGFPRAATSDW